MILDIIIILLLIGSAFFFLVGTIGLIRMPDAFCRMHATTKCDTLGAGLALLAVILLRGVSVVSIKVFLIIVFIWITNPTAAHIVAKAYYKKENVKVEDL